MTALAADFAALPTVKTLALVDHRVSTSLPGCRVISVRSREKSNRSLADWSRDVDWTIVIAPDFELTRCRLVEVAGGHLLGPSAKLVRLAADKQQTAEHLSAARVRVPGGIAITPLTAIPVTFPFPAVIKPRFGAGSQDVRLIRNRADLGKWRSSPLMRIEEFCPGMAASVAFLCGPNGCFSLPPCRQRLSDDGEFRYLGGAVPLAPALARRATELAARAVATLPTRSAISASIWCSAMLPMAGRRRDRDQSSADDIVRRPAGAGRENLAAAMLDVGSRPAAPFIIRRPPTRI